jgi:hypothetical protein
MRRMPGRMMVDGKIAINRYTCYRGRKDTDERDDEEE